MLEDVSLLSRTRQEKRLRYRSRGSWTRSCNIKSLPEQVQQHLLDLQCPQHPRHMLPSEPVESCIVNVWACLLQNFLHVLFSTVQGARHSTSAASSAT